MSCFFQKRYGVLVVALALGVVLSACGVNTSGEPEIVREMEIVSPPTDPPPTVPEPTDMPPTPAPAGEEAAPSGAAEATPETAGDAGDPSAGDYDMADRAPGAVEGLSAEEYLLQSITAPGAFVVENYQDVMPKDYGETLSEDEVNGLVTFILEFDPQSMMDDAADDESTSDSAASLEQDETLVVRGHLVQGTADGEVIPAGLPMQLYVLDVHGNLAGIYETESAEGGAYIFEDVARALRRDDHAGCDRLRAHHRLLDHRYHLGADADQLRAD